MIICEKEMTYGLWFMSMFLFFCFLIRNISPHLYMFWDSDFNAWFANSQVQNMKRINCILFSHNWFFRTWLLFQSSSTLNIFHTLFSFKFRLFSHSRGEGGWCFTFECVLFVVWMLCYVMLSLLLNVFLFGFNRIIRIVISFGCYDK